MSVLLSLLGKIGKAVLPSIGKEKDKLKAVDGLLSKRGEVTKMEVMYALSIKLFNLIIYAYLVWAIVNDKLSLMESLKLLIQ
jgi:hypothetical protein